MIQELVNYCSTCYDFVSGKAPFVNGQCVSCVKCLKEIHFNRESNRKYDCLAMCYYYVCCDIYRYATEMIWLFHDKELGLKQRKSPLKICSIGCGPCSELVAFEEYYKKYQLSFEFTYDGFDTNEIWNPVQKYVKSISSHPENITFHNHKEDVFDYYTKHDTKPNLIVLNYVLSDILKHEKDNFQIFLNKLDEFIQKLPSCAILINDINNGVNENYPRYYYESIIKMVSNNVQPDKCAVKESHFPDSKKYYHTYGTPREKNSLLFKVPEEISNKFATNTECHSAQLLIVKKK